MWTDCRARFGGGGPFLFGTFGAADAMYAPVVSRFHTYAVEVGAASRAYMAAVMALPAWQEWRAAALQGALGARRGRGRLAERVPGMSRFRARRSLCTAGRKPVAKKNRGLSTGSAAGAKKIRAPLRTRPVLAAPSDEGLLANKRDQLLTVWSCHHAISCDRHLFCCVSALAGITRSQPRGRGQERRQGALHSDRLPGRDRARGDHLSVSLRLQNYGLPPERLALSVAGVPPGWTATLIGGGQPVAAAMPGDQHQRRRSSFASIFRKDAPVGTTNLTVNAEGSTTKVAFRSR